MGYQIKYNVVNLQWNSNRTLIFSGRIPSKQLHIHKAQHTSRHAICTCNPHRKPENNAHHVDKQSYIHSTVTERQTFPASLSARLFFLCQHIVYRKSILTASHLYWGGGGVSFTDFREGTERGEKKQKKGRKKKKKKKENHKGNL